VKAEIPFSQYVGKLSMSMTEKLIKSGLKTRSLWSWNLKPPQRKIWRECLSGNWG